MHFNLVLTICIFVYDIIQYADAVTCKPGGDFSEPSPYACTGDYCIMELSKIDGTSRSSPVGCISGYPNVEPGCYNQPHSNDLCYCNSAPLCNKRDMRETLKNLTTQVQCNDETFVNNKIEGNKTCTGSYCFLGTAPGHMDSAYVGCAQEPASLRWLKGAWCVTSTVHVQSTGQLQNTLTCSCDTNLCNNPSTFAGFEKSATLKCQSGLFNKTSTTDNNSTPTTFQVCPGAYCYTQTSTQPGYDLEKGCVMLPDGAKFAVEKYEYNVGPVLKTYFCNKDFCNRDHDKLFR